MINIINYEKNRRIISNYAHSYIAYQVLGFDGEEASGILLVLMQLCSHYSTDDIWAHMTYLKRSWTPVLYLKWFVFVSILFNISIFGDSKWLSTVGELIHIKI